MNTTLKTLILVSLFLHFAAGLLSPVYALYVQSIGGTLEQVGVTFAAMPFIIAIGLLILGKQTDKTGNEESYLLLGYVLKVIGFSGYLLVSTVPQLIIVQCILGISYVISTPAYQSLYTKHLTKGKFAQNWSVWEAVTQLSAATAAIVGSLVLKLFGFQSLFLLMTLFATLGLATTVILLRLKKTNQHT